MMEETNVETVETLDAENRIPDAKTLFERIGCFLSTIIAAFFELIDNSISAKASKILITLTENDDDTVTFELEDNGPGIKNPNHAWTMGDTSQQKSLINHFGMGLKLAVAKLAELNGYFIFATKTLFGKTKVLEGPYDYYKPFAVKDKWIGKFDTGSGTYFKITMTRQSFKSICFAKNTVLFRTMCDNLYEHIGFRYAEVIQKGVQITMVINYLDDNSETHVVTPLLPNAKPLDYVNETDSADYKNNNHLLVQVNLLEMEPLPTRKEFDNTTSRMYYKRNMISQGGQIKLNNIIIVNNIVSPIWPKRTIHPALNYLLVDIKLSADFPEYLPRMTTIKGNLDYTDKTWEEIWAQVRSLLPNPVEKKDNKSSLEDKLMMKLMDVLTKKKLYTTIVPQMPLGFEDELESIDDLLRADLYCTKVGKPAVIYECKAKKADAQDVMQAVLYQILSYADSNVNAASHTVLVAPEFSQAAIKTAEDVNANLRRCGKKLRVELKEYADFGINYSKVKCGK